MNYNKVQLAGNLTRDPELRYTPSGKAIAKLGVAINRNWTNETGEKKEEVTFVDVDCFGRTAENCGQYLKKGRGVFVEGRLKLDSWDDKQTGAKRNRLCVVAESVQFVGGRDATTETRQERPASAPAESAEPPESGDVPF